MNMISTTHDGFGFSMSEKDNAFNFSGVTSVSINFTGYLLFTLNYHNTELDDLIQTPGFGLYKWLPNGTLGGTWEDQYELLANISMSDVGITTTGIYHIDIIRKNDGNITVSLDGQKIMSVVDNTYTTSEKVMLWSWLGKTKYDNFNVSKEDVPTTSLSTSSTSNDTASKEIDSSLSIASTFICISLLPVIRRTRK